MKKINIFILIVFVLLVSGCKQAAVEQKNQEAVGSDKAQTNSEIKSMPNYKPIQGTYKGTYDGGTCGKYDFAIAISGDTVKGTGIGSGELNCNINLTGTADGQGNVTGQATGTYTMTSQGAIFEWYLEGPFSGMLKDIGGDLTIQMEGKGHMCPPNIPCNDEPDTIILTLFKI